MQFKFTVTSKDNQTADAVKKILKTIIDPIDIKIGTRTFNPLLVQFKSLLHGQEGCVFFSVGI
jgi:hypothetical protein